MGPIDVAPYQKTTEIRYIFFTDPWQTPCRIGKFTPVASYYFKMKNEDSPCTNHIAEGDQDIGSVKVGKEDGCVCKILSRIVWGRLGNLLGKGHSVELDDLNHISDIDLDALVEEFWNAWKKEGELEEKYGRRRAGIRLCRTYLRSLGNSIINQLFFSAFSAAVTTLAFFYFYFILNVFYIIANAREEGVDVNTREVGKAMVSFVIISSARVWISSVFFPLRFSMASKFQAMILLWMEKKVLDLEGYKLTAAIGLVEVITSQLTHLSGLVFEYAYEITTILQAIGALIYGSVLSGWHFVLVSAVSVGIAICLPYIVGANHLDRIYKQLRSAGKDEMELVGEAIANPLEIKLSCCEVDKAEAIKNSKTRPSKLLFDGRNKIILLSSGNLGSMFISTLLLMIIWILTDYHIDYRGAITSVALVRFLSDNIMSSLLFVRQRLQGIAWEVVVSLEELGRLCSDTSMTSIKHDTAFPPEYPQIQRLKRISLQGSFCRKRVFADGDLQPALRSDNFVLKDIDIEVFDGELLCILGPTGSGKTFLLMAMLQEAVECLPSSPTKECIGYYHPILGSVSYAGQDQWIHSGTIRDNILFGSEFDKERYDRVVIESGLEFDLLKLRYGDLSLVGSRGIKLSGGQKARISLARLAYRDADVYLMDDPLSSVDYTTGQKIYNNLICGLLREKTRVMVTHHLSYFQNDQKVVLLGKGGVVQAVSSWADVKNIDSGIAIDPATRNPARVINGGLYGSVSEEISELASSLEGRFSNSFMIKNIDSGIVIDPATRNPDRVINDGPSGSMSEEISEIASHLDSRFSTSFKCAFGRWGYLPGAFVFLLMSVASQGSLFYVAIWIESHTMESNAIWWGLGLFAFALFIFCSSYLGSWLFHRSTLKVSTVLHKNMVDAVVRAPMGFFDKNTYGAILSRFSIDMSCVFEEIPNMTFAVLGQAFSVLGLVIVSLALQWTTVFFSLLVIISYCYIFYVVRPAVCKTRLIGKTLTSSAISLSMEAMEGIITIRAFGAQSFWTSKLRPVLVYLINAEEALYTFSAWCVSRCSTATMIFSVLLFIGAILYTINNPHLSRSEILLFGLIIGLFQQTLSIVVTLIECYYRLEYYLLSYARVVQYSEIEPEAAWYSEKGPPDNWPSKGKISVVNLWARYAAKCPYVLCGMSFEIHPGMVVGIVGRTGSGKTSFVKALLRILEYESSRGYIEIDGIKTCDIGLHELRQQISVVSQNSTLFASTIRHNMDPNGKASDAEIWEALEKVNLKDCISSLDAGTTGEDCVKLSTGQKQQLCFARVLLNKSTIYVFDEATAFLDAESDLIIQSLIKKLKNCTLLLVAHRLRTIIEADKVFVIESGKLGEHGSPHELLKDKNSMFTKMATNSGALDTLRTLAKDTFTNSNMNSNIP